jgi:hypothetical protein
MTADPPFADVAATDQVKATAPTEPALSVTVTTTGYTPSLVGEPEMRPVAGSTVIPAGRAEPLYVSVWLASESVAWICNDCAVPGAPPCGPGVVTVIVLLPADPTIAHRNVA